MATILEPTGGMLGGLDLNTASAVAGQTDLTSQELKPVAQGPRPNKLEPLNQPTLGDFLKEAKTLGTEMFQSQAEQLRGETSGQAADLSRQLYGQNVGGTSGIGQNIVDRAIATQAKRLEPVGKEIALRTAQDELARQAQERTTKQGQDFASEEAEKGRKEVRQQQLFQLIQDGRLTGDDALEIVQDYMGITLDNLKIPDVRDQEISNIVDSFTALGQSVNWDILNDALVAKGYEPVTEGEKMLAEGASGVQKKLKEPITEYYPERGGQNPTYNSEKNIPKSADAQMLQSKGVEFELTSSVDESSGDNQKISYSWVIKDTPANDSKLRELYKNDPDVKAFMNRS